MNPPVFPSFADYQTALQHPEISFSSNFLRQGLVERDLWGFPRVRSGGFALTYKVEVKDNTWAARCFHRAVRDRAIRYSQICQTLEDLSLPFFVPTRYFQRGIAIHGKHFPISIVEWIEGESLENYVFHHLGKPEDLLALGEKFRFVCRELEANRLAHGDLSHRNIIIKAGEVFLIDYDGMYVPALAGRKSNELGNIHFQHPTRSNTDYDEKLDRFSTLVIYLALNALAAEPALWEEFQYGGEGLLFQRSDFVDPENSRLLHRLANIPSVSHFIPSFMQICQSSIDNVPSLEEYISGKTNNLLVTLKPSRNKSVIKKANVPVYQADRLPSILQSIGQIVTVIGEVKEVFHGHTEEGADHIFINFGNWQEDCFTAVIWGGVLEDFKRISINPDGLTGKIISVTGLMSIRNKRPQMVLEAITDLLIKPQKQEIEKPSFRTFNVPEGSMNAKKAPETIKSGDIDIFSPKIALNTRISLDDIFKNETKTGLEEVLNQLYSAERFRNNKKS